MRGFIFGLAALAALTGVAARANPPSSAFGNLPFMSHPALSPDGRHFATLQSLNGRPVAVIYPVNAGPDDSPAVIGSDQWIVDQIAWAKNDRLIVFIKTSRKIGDEANLMHSWERAMSVDAKGGNAVMLMKDNVDLRANTDAARIVDLDLDDPEHIYMQIYVYADLRSPADEATDSKLGRQDRNLFRDDLYRVDLRTGAEEKVMSGNHDTVEWIMDGHGGIVARLDRTQTPLLDHLWVYRDKSFVEVGKYDASADGGASILGLSADGTSLLREVWRPGGTIGITRLDLADGSETQLYDNPQYDVRFSVVDDFTHRVLGAQFMADKNEYHFFDPKWDGLQKGIEAAFPNVSATAAAWDAALDKVIVSVDAPRTPTTYYFLDRTTHRADKIGSAYPDLKDSDLGEMKPYPYKARDGLDIPAYLTLPPGKTAKNLPVVVMPHGGPDDRDGMGFDWWAQFLANRGYAVLQPNYRGSLGYGRHFTEAGLHQWGLKMQDDISDGVGKMIADGIADPKRVCIVGASYGGYAALAGAAFSPELYACAVSVAGVSDLPEALRAERARYGKDSGTASFWISRIGSPYDDSEQLRATSPARHADQVKCPVLLMHGEGDVTVPIRQSELMESALKSAGKPVELIRFEGEDHYLNLAATRIRVLEETEAFLKKNIGN